MTRKQKLGIATTIIGVFAFAIIIFSLVFALTAIFYHFTGHTPAQPVAYVINIAIGLVSCFVILALLARYFGSKQVEAQSGAFTPIIEALQKIAKGDFSVRIDTSNALMGKLATNVNNMALELDQMERMRQEFISNVSHEIQSPLTSIRGFARALNNDQLTAEDRIHYLDIIENESTRLARLTDNLLKLASLEAEHVKFEPKPYRLDKQIRSLILACEPQWISKAIDMDVSLAEATITADEDLLSQVWINLIHNSIKFTPTNGKICVDLQCHEVSLEFKISDTGIGLSEAEQAHIFERFYKADKSRTGNGGSGLGLSIAQKIVAMHTGTIAVTSQPGIGSTFTVCLPI